MQVPAHELEAAQIIVLLTAVAIAVSWRAVVRSLAVVITTVVIATMGFGLIMIWLTAHHAAV